MKVLITFLSFAEDTFGGIENSILNLALGLQKNGVEVAVYCSFLGSNSNQIRGIRVIRSHLVLPDRLPQGNTQIDDAIKAHFSCNGSAICSEIAAIVRQGSFDCVISIDPLWGIAHPVGLTRHLRCPVILSFHVLNNPQLLREVAKTPYHMLRSVSERLKSDILDVVPGIDIKVVPNSIDLETFSPSEQSTFDSNVIFCNSRFDPGKGVIDLVRGFAEFKKLKKDYELWLCGGVSPFGDRGLAVNDILGEITALGLSASVRVLPNLKWRDIPDYIRKSFAVVLPTYYETFGRAALEAMACGVPLIASAVGNLPDLIAGSGLLVEPHSPSAISSALVSLAENSQLHSSLSEMARLQSSGFDNAVVASQFLKRADIKWSRP